MTAYAFEYTGTVISASGNSTNVADCVNPAAFPDGKFTPQNLSILVRVTAVSGTTPSLTIEVVWSNDGTNFVSAATPDTFTAITAAGSVVKTFQVKARFARLKYTVTGTTPTETVDITALAN